MQWLVVLSILFLAPFASLAASTAQDHAWLVVTHQANLAEIRSGNVAARSGHAESVRGAGTMLVADHQALDAKLVQVAGQLGVKLPDAPNAKQRAAARRLQGEPATTFDRTWAHDEAGDHVESIESTEREIQHGAAPQVRQLAQAALPILKKHLRVLNAALAKISGSE